MPISSLQLLLFRVIMSIDFKIALMVFISSVLWKLNGFHKAKIGFPQQLKKLQTQTIQMRKLKVMDFKF